MSNIHNVVQIFPNLRIGEICIDIKYGKEKQIQQLFLKLKIEWPLLLSDHQVNVQGEFSQSYLEEQFLVFKKLAKCLDDSNWYVYDEVGNIYNLKINKSIFTYKHIKHAYKDFFEYYKASFPKNKEIIFALLKNRIYEDVNIANAHDTFFKVYEKNIKAALAIHPDAWDILQSYAVVLSNRKNYKKAISIERQALRIKHSLNKHDDYDSLLLYSNLANSLVGDKQYEAALKCVAKAENIIPNRGDYRILEKKAYAYLGLKNYEMVVKVCDEIIQKSLRRSDIAYAFFNKAAALTMLKRYSESAAALAAAYSLDSNLPRLAERDLENIMWFKILLKKDSTEDIMGELYKYIKKFNE